VAADTATAAVIWAGKADGHADMGDLGERGDLGIIMCDRCEIDDGGDIEDIEDVGWPEVRVSCGSSGPNILRLRFGFWRLERARTGCERAARESFLMFLLLVVLVVVVLVLAVVVLVLTSVPVLTRALAAPYIAPGDIAIIRLVNVLSASAFSSMSTPVYGEHGNDDGGSGAIGDDAIASISRGGDGDRLLAFFAFLPLVFSSSSLPWLEVEPLRSRAFLPTFTGLPSLPTFSDRMLL
jgi:hypothetical protein